MRPRLSLYVILLALIVCIPGVADAELVSTLFSWDGGDTDRVPPEYPDVNFSEIPTDSLRTVGLPVHPENGDYVISAAIHWAGPPYDSNTILYLGMHFPEFADRQDLYIRCSYLYLNTTSYGIQNDFVGGDDLGLLLQDPGGGHDWVHAESAMEPFTPVGPNGYQWVSFNASYLRLPQDASPGYYLLDNIRIEVFDATGVPVETLSIGTLKAAY